MILVQSQLANVIGYQQTDISEGGSRNTISKYYKKIIIMKGLLAHYIEKFFVGQSKTQECPSAPKETMRITE